MHKQMMAAPTAGLLKPKLFIALWIMVINGFTLPLLVQAEAVTSAASSATVTEVATSQAQLSSSENTSVSGNTSVSKKISVTEKISAAQETDAADSSDVSDAGIQTSSVQLSAGSSSTAIEPTQVSTQSSSVSSLPTETFISSASSEAELANVVAEENLVPLISSKFILDAEVRPSSSVRLTWNPDAATGGFSEQTPVLVVNGKTPGKTLCLTGALHGDELNGIEMIRRVIFSINPEKLTGTIIGVPVANIMGFRRNSRYLPDRRDWNRYFPGNTRGSSASRLAHSFFTKIIMHCDALVDIHTGSFHRTNLPQLRADLADENVARLAQHFGSIAVLNSRGNPNSLRAAAVRAGIPAITLEAGEPMAMQSEVVVEGVAAINTLLAKIGMYGKQKTWNRIAPVYYRSTWVRANQSGILFSKVTLGERIKAGEVLGVVTDPITNGRSTIYSPYHGRILGMALDQVVLPGFAAYHIGIQTPEAILIEESQLNNNGLTEEDEEDGDDAGIDPSDGLGTQDQMLDE